MSLPAVAARMEVADQTFILYNLAMPARSAIALGSNIPDRLANLQCGLDLFRKFPGIDIIAVSRVYESVPEGENLSGDFLNAVMVIDTSLSARELLDKCLEVEANCGRDRNSEKISNSRNRTLDLDVIFFGDERINRPDLIVPHPRWQERDFVVLPLTDLLADLTDRQHIMVKEAAGRFPLIASCRPVSDLVY
jgi:2-amino-4-hydroxy-6-hydroxymethyldihydropteridine diphosphokinase